MQFYLDLSSLRKQELLHILADLTAGYSSREAEFSVEVKPLTAHSCLFRLLARIWASPWPSAKWSEPTIPVTTKRWSSWSASWRARPSPSADYCIQVTSFWRWTVCGWTRRRPCNGSSAPRKTTWWRSRWRERSATRLKALRWVIIISAWVLLLFHKMLFLL